MALVQLFLNDSEPRTLIDLLHQLDSKGYTTKIAPTSGCTALWVNDYEITGYNYVERMLKSLFLTNP